MITQRKLTIIVPTRDFLDLIDYRGKIRAGFPSPADDYKEEKLDLNVFLVKHPSATFYIRVDGDSMNGAGMTTDDILIVDRSLTASHNDVIVAVIDGGFTIKRLVEENGKFWLKPENNHYRPIDLTGKNFQIWGVVVHIIHNPKSSLL